MIQNLGLTYSPFTIPGGLPQTHQRAPQQESGDGRSTSGSSKPIEAKPLKTEVAPLGGIHGITPSSWQEAQTQMAQIVNRLNQRSAHLQDQISFKLEQSRNRPQVVMTDGDQIVQRYEVTDIVDLERSLYDMAGFQLSLEG